MESAQSAEELLRLADRPKQLYAEAILRVRATTLENGKEGAPAEFDLYKKGEDRALIVFRTGTQKGRKILTVGDKFWLLVPGVTHAIPVSANQRLMGGASIADAARLHYSEDFSAVLSGTEEVNGLSCDVLQLTARSPSASYRTGTLWVDRNEHLARKAVLNLASGRSAKEILFESYGREAGNLVLRTMRIRDLLSTKTNLETELEYLEFRKAELPDDLFTPEGALRFS